MGLLDIFDDDQGRLALGLLAASGPRMEPTSLGQRFAQALGSAQQAKVASEERQMAQEYRRSQIEAAQAQAAERQRQMQAAEQLERQMMQLDPTGRAAIVARLNPAKAAEMFMPQQGPKVGTPNPSDFTPESLAQYVKTNDIGVLRRLEPAPKPPAPLELERLQALRDALPPGDPRRAEFEAAIRKSTQFAPPMNVQVGLQAPVPYQLPNGQVGYIQPPNRPGAAPQVLEVGGAPAIRPPGGDGKLPAELQRMNIAGQTMGTLLNDYEKWLSQNNPRDLSVQMNPAARADAQSLMKNIQLQFKELQGLGALTGPDVEIMERALSDPFSFKGAFYGPDGLRSQINRARQLIDERTRATANTQGQPGAARRNAEQGPEQQKPRSKIVRLDDGGSVSAELGPDGNYYVIRNGKRYRVEE